MSRRRALTLVVLGAAACAAPLVSSCGTGTRFDVSDVGDVGSTGDVGQGVIVPAQCGAPSSLIVGVHQFGTVRVRVYDSGHVAFDEPDLAGNPHAITIAYGPPAAKFADVAVLASSVSSVQDLAGGGLAVTFAMGGRSVVARLTSTVAGVVRYEIADWGGAPPSEATIAAPSDPTEHFYGFGEKFNALDQSGNTVDVLTSDHPGAKGDHSYKVAPWFVSTKGYGFHLDSSAESFFHMRSLSPTCYYVTSRQGSSFAFNFSAGPALTDVIGHYTSYSGRPALPPPFAFGPWLSSDVWRDGGEVRFVAETMKSLGIPGSVFVFDSPWEVAYNDLQINMAQFGAGSTYATPVVDGAGRWTGAYAPKFYPGFGSSAEMMSFLRAHGYKVVLWLTPIVDVQSFGEGIPGQNTGKAGTYDDGIAHDVFVHAHDDSPLVIDWWKGRGSPIDFTSPAASIWFTSKLTSLVAASGGVIGGFKTDDGESHTDPSGTKSGVYIPEDAKYADGRTGVEMRNGYALEYQRAVWGVLGASGVLLSRGGFTGTQAFPAGWAGDNEPSFDPANGLPSVIIAGQSAAMSGYAIWGSDIGGYQDTGPITNPNRTAQEEATVENLFMRWTQFGALSPMMQLHRQISAHHQYAWSFGTTALDNYRTFARLHTSLFPYLYSYAKEANDTGVPIIRPEVLMNPGDPATFGIRYVYYLGRELLVAPIMADNPTRDVTLPQGMWVDFLTGQAHAGGQPITVTAKGTELPLFVRQGSIVPMLLDDPLSLNDASYVGAGGVSTPSGGLSFVVVPKATEKAQFALYDGTSIGAAQSGATTTVDLTSSPRAIQLRVLAQPTTVTRDGATVPQLGKAAFDQATTGWMQDASFALIKFGHAGGASQVVAN